MGGSSGLGRTSLMTLSLVSVVTVVLAACPSSVPAARILLTIPPSLHLGTTNFGWADVFRISVRNGAKLTRLKSNSNQFKFYKIESLLTNFESSLAHVRKQNECSCTHMARSSWAYTHEAFVIMVLSLTSS